MSAQSNLVERLVEITACNTAEAEHLLAACANNVEAAVALYFEQGGGAAGGSDNGPPIIPVDESDDVRAPIAPIREQLIGPEDDNFFATAQPVTTGRMSRVTQRVKVCPLRDFAREGALMEEQLQASGLFTEAPGSSISSRRMRATNMVAAAQAIASEAIGKPSSSRLGDLFRPPTELLYSGTFQAARGQATKRKQWLLVNVQSDNFDSQLLNRDVWSDKKLKQLVRSQFTFWQVDCDSSEGRRFVAFYHCSKKPYVCVIDPRTGEEVWRSLGPKQSNVFSDLEQFLREHKDFCNEDLNDDAKPSSSKRVAAYTVKDGDGYDDDTASCSTTINQGKSNIPRKRAKVLELSEEEQIALAIKNSMAENGNDNENGRNSIANIGGDCSNGSTKSGIAENDEDNASDCGSLEEFGEDELKAACEFTSYEQLLGTANHELTALKLRLLNASGTDEMVQLRWPSDTKLLALRSYISQQYPHIPKEEASYKLICAFPRKTLEKSSNGATLKELGLHPSANLHLTLDD